MTYSTGYRILASDYNGFVNNNSQNINAWWATGSGNAGWGQSSLSTVTQGTKINASSWAAIVNTLQTSSNHTGTTITSRTAPVTGDTIAILSNMATDIDTITGNRLNAVASGAQYVTWSGTSYQSTNWATSLTFTHTITFASATLAFSPPLSTLIFLSMSSPLNKKQPSKERSSSSVCWLPQCNISSKMVCCNLSASN